MGGNSEFMYTNEMQQEWRTLRTRSAKVAKYLVDEKVEINRCARRDI